MPCRPFRPAMVAAALVLLVLVAPAGALPATGEPAPARQATDRYAAWARVLDKYVDGEGLVDYAGLKAHGMDDLGAFMDIVASTNPDTLSTDAERMAFWINAYNAVIVWQVVERYPIESVRDVGVLWGLVGGFFKNEYRVAGRDMSADNIEHDTLRADFDDTRIHWALVCGAFGCPRLLDRPYRADDLDATLGAQAREFLHQPRGLQLDRATSTLHLSSYFDWYEDDFVNDAGTVIDYVLRYAPDDVTSFIRDHRDTLRVRIMDYDWILNEASRGPRSRRPVPR